MDRHFDFFGVELWHFIGPFTSPSGVYSHDPREILVQFSSQGSYPFPFRYPRKVGRVQLFLGSGEPYDILRWFTSHRKVPQALWYIYLAKFPRASSGKDSLMVAALDFGSRGRGFESRRLQYVNSNFWLSFFWFWKQNMFSRAGTRTHDLLHWVRASYLYTTKSEQMFYEWRKFIIVGCDGNGHHTISFFLRFYQDHGYSPQIVM